MRKKLLMILVLMSLITGSAFANNINNTANIKVVPKNIKILANGENINHESFLYKGKVYAPIEKVADKLGAITKYDTNNQSLVIADKNILDYKEVKNNTSNKPLVKIEDISYNMSIIEKGNYNAIIGSFKNNSFYNILSIQMTLLIKNTNQKVFVSEFETLLSGQNSPMFETKIPKDITLDDIKIVETEYSIIDDKGNKIFINFDNDKKNYKLIK